MLKVKIIHSICDELELDTPFLADQFQRLIYTLMPIRIELGHKYDHNRI